MWELKLISPENLIPKTDIFHSLHLYLPPLSSIKCILTVHDCRKLGLPSLYSSKIREEYRQIMQKSLRRADHVVAVSEFTKSELSTYFNYPLEKVTVIHNGIDIESLQHISKVCGQDSLSFSNRIGGPYIIYTGSLEERKNLHRLIIAYANFSDSKKDAPNLAITGTTLEEWKRSPFSVLSRKLGIAAKIRILGELPKAELFRAIKSAEALCYPSLYEGFGLPPLEAMALNVPVMAGNYAVANEILSDAALIVDPFSEFDMANGMNSIIYDNEVREKLINSGRIHVKRYSWETSAKNYLSVYQKSFRS